MKLIAEIEMFLLPILAIVPGQIPLVEDFPKDIQLSAITATVQIHDRGKNVDGSGAIIGQKGPYVYILTADHVVPEGKRLLIRMFSQQKFPRAAHLFLRDARVIARSRIKDTDLALVQLKTVVKPPSMLKVCPPSKIPKGKSFSFLSIGCGNGTPPFAQLEKVNRKILVRKKGVRKSPGNYWEINERPIRGRSGGPLIDRHGNLLGICSIASEDRGYYTHTEEIHDFLRRNAVGFLIGK